MRVDEKTKEVIQEWQLTTVRRWAASPNSFTLDFGDYSESYYSVQTQVGYLFSASELSTSDSRTSNYSDFSMQHPRNLNICCRFLTSLTLQEGEKISQLISQYIDLIMKNKTGGDRRLSETDEEATVIEDQVRPGMPFISCWGQTFCFKFA